MPTILKDLHDGNIAQRYSEIYNEVVGADGSLDDLYAIFAAE